MAGQSAALGRVSGPGSALGDLHPEVPAPLSGPPGPRERRELRTLLRWTGGVVVLAILAYLMWTSGEWTAKLFAWVLLTILADEFGGWFGYVGLLLGGLGYLSPGAPPEQWMIVLPLVGGALAGLLLVKHSGGPLVLPFAGALYAGTLWAVGQYATQLDPQMKLPGTDAFQRSAWLPMVIGLGLSFVRQLVGIVLRRRARRGEDLAASPPGA